MSIMVGKVNNLEIDKAMLFAQIIAGMLFVRLVFASQTPLMIINVLYYLDMT